MPTIGLLKAGSIIADRTRANALDHKSEQVTVRPSYRDYSEKAAGKHSSYYESNVSAGGGPLQVVIDEKQNMRKRTIDSHLLKKNLKPFGSAQISTIAGTVP